MNTFLRLKAGGYGEIEEKKSRFIANIRPVDSEEEAVAFINEMKKKYWDARHNCSAFVIGEKMELTRCSDDGEPSGTAGRPMLEVLLGKQITNICVVVTRYFGGVLLGTGGLVRAYQSAVKEGLINSVIVEMQEGYELTVTVGYDLIGKFQYVISQEDVILKNTEYAENVVFSILVPNESTDSFIKKLTEAAGGQLTIEKSDPCSYEKAASL